MLDFSQKLNELEGAIEIICRLVHAYIHPGMKWLISVKL